MDGGVGEIPRIAVELYGTIPEGTVRSIRQEVEACYRALTVPLPEVVSLCLFDTLARWREYAARRREEAGVITAGEEGFLTTHEAWEGVPRLSVCLERLEAQPPLVQQGALHQVVAHSVLHGRPDFYRFAIPRSLIAESRARGVELEIFQQILYFVAIAIKGYQAVSLLVEHRFIQDQVALALHQLEAGEDDVALWKMARWEPRARLLYLSAQLKPLLYLRPLLPYAPELAEAGRAMLSHLPPEEIERLEGLVEELVAQHSGDTHRDVSAGLALVLSRL
ncbi:MAG: hypothetical protein ACP5OO_01270 [Chloroflexia bacterium]